MNWRSRRKTSWCNWKPRKTDKRKDGIIELNKKINCNDLTYYYKCHTVPQKFDYLKNAFILLDKKKNGESILEDTKKEQKTYKSNLNEIKRGKAWHKSVIYNAEMFYKPREDIIKFYDDYSAMVPESLYKAKHGEGLATLALKKCFKDYQ